MKHLKAAIATVLLLSVLCVGGCNMAIPTMPIRPNEIKGLNQAYADQLMSLDYSPDCQNIDVSEGILSTRTGSNKLAVTALEGETIISVMVFRTEAGNGTVIIGTDDGESGYKWYFNDGGTWTEITTDPGGVSLTTLNPEYARSQMVKIADTEVMILVAVTGAPVKIWYDSDDSAFYYAALGGSPPSEARFITYHRERTWLAPDDTDLNTVYYSNAFDPEDWTTAGETGTITIESFDGDNIAGIYNIFDDVIVFKQNTIWRIVGDTPDDYAVEQVYGVQGLTEIKGVCQDGGYCFFTGEDGIYQYDGTNAYPILTDEIKDIYKGMTQAICLLVNNKLYVLDRRTVPSYTGKSIIYDVRTKKIEVISMQEIYDAVSTEAGYNIRIYYTDGEYVYYLFYTKLTFADTDIDAYWYTPETDFGLPNATKTLTNIYINGYGTTSAGAAGGQLKVTIYYNENGTIKTKEKTITLQTTTKVHNISLSVTGRSFKFKFENVDGSAFHIMPTWIYEVDKD